MKGADLDRVIRRTKRAHLPAVAEGLRAHGYLVTPSLNYGRALTYRCAESRGAVGLSVYSAPYTDASKPLVFRWHVDRGNARRLEFTALPSELDAVGRWLPDLIVARAEETEIEAPVPLDPRWPFSVRADYMWTAAAADLYDAWADLSRRRASAIAAARAGQAKAEA